MRIAETMMVLAFSSFEVSFPWYLWVIALCDIFIRISDDHKDWLRNKLVILMHDINLLEEKRSKLEAEVRKLQNPHD